ncbi:MAG: hypothetical protein H6983_19030 [Ectothiorhodospiraceae bacterium]|nr:hypothetical protein [Chromatiales bacterium]MCP5156275.1 hypothetical protein [Ectothiorhodospiraceae bacterium]
MTSHRYLRPLGGLAFLALTPGLVLATPMSRVTFEAGAGVHQSSGSILLTPLDRALGEAVGGAVARSAAVADRIFTGLGGDGSDAEMRFSVRAQGEASPLALRTAMEATLSSPYYNPANEPLAISFEFVGGDSQVVTSGTPTFLLTQVFASFEDVIEVDAVAPVHRVAIEFELDGTLSPTGAAFTMAEAWRIYDLDGSGLVVASNLLSARTIGRSDQPTSASGAFEVDFLPSLDGSVVLGLGLQNLVEIDLTSPAVVAGGDITVSLDFQDTLQVTAMRAFDALGNRLAISDVRSQSGFDYRGLFGVTAVAVPEPSTALLAALGALGLTGIGGRGARRR